jgi:hypothetical protein
MGARAMHGVGPVRFGVDGATKFHHSLRVFGWVLRDGDALADVSLVGAGVVGARCHVGLGSAAGDGAGFVLQVLMTEDRFPNAAVLRFTTRTGHVTTGLLAALIADYPQRLGSVAMEQRFFAEANRDPAARILDIGGRAHSSTGNRQFFPDRAITVFDFIAHPSVDAVGDAHILSHYFPPAHFDVVISIAVFEHILMPWTVAVQMNAVMKPGAIALVSTIQTIGLHDTPWDFWRFSDTAWDALFNPRTGFEIVERVMDDPQHILPVMYQPYLQHAEFQFGCARSTVWIRKTGPSHLSWDVTAAEITPSHYPGGTTLPEHQRRKVGRRRK